MQIYNYHPITREYLGTEIADESPLDPGVYLIPQYATTVAPPTVLAHEVAIFESGSWIVKPDWRGHVFYDAQTRYPIIIDSIGVQPDPAWATSPAPSQYHVWDGMSWVLDLNLVRAAVVKEIEETAEAAAARYITSMPSQIARYILKLEEARAHMAAAYPADLAAYPMIAAELRALQVQTPTATAQQASDFILSRAELWTQKGAQIEEVRRIGKERAAAATTEEVLYTARDAAVSALQAL